MTARTFVDSNVWVYAVDADEPVKRDRARYVLAPSSRESLVVSSQVLGEFYVTVTRKLARPVPVGAAESMVDQMRQLPVVPLDAELVGAAIAGSRIWQLSYWDALIIAAAQVSGCSSVMTEDLADGATYGDVQVTNPFAGRHRASEEPLALEHDVGSWDDTALARELARYEEACREARMRPNAIHSYWDYARRFLNWRTGDYRPRGMADTGRPVPRGAVNAEELGRQAKAYARVVEEAGREQATIDTYYRHAMFFVRWLGGVFRPGDRLR
jgi:predicted nucleic acid-binding protein